MKSETTQWGLNSSAVAGMRAVLTKFPQVSRAILYGSRAKGNFKPGSDIDICLDGDGLTFRTMLTIASALDALELPHKVDIVLRGLITNPELLNEINRTGAIFYQPGMPNAQRRKPPGWGLRQ